VDNEVIKEIEEKLRKRLDSKFNALKQEIEEIISPKLDEILQNLKSFNDIERVKEMLDYVELEVLHLKDRLDKLEQKRKLFRQKRR